MAEDDSVTTIYVRALRHLYRAAGSPTYEVIRAAQERDARKPFSRSSWSDWLNGKNVPSKKVEADWLIAYLRGRAASKSRDFAGRSPDWFEDVRIRARTERRAAKGDAPPPTARLDSRSGPVPRQLPSGSRDFVGREDELAKLVGTIPRDHPDPGEPAAIFVITGTAGVGKSALAVHWARRHADRFPDGQVYLDLRGFDPQEPMASAEALGHLLNAFGVAPEAFRRGWRRGPGGIAACWRAAGRWWSWTTPVTRSRSVPCYRAPREVWRWSPAGATSRASCPTSPTG